MVGRVVGMVRDTDNVEDNTQILSYSIIIHIILPR